MPCAMCHVQRTPDDGPQHAVWCDMSSVGVGGMVLLSGGAPCALQRSTLWRLYNNIDLPGLMLVLIQAGTT